MTMVRPVLRDDPFAGVGWSTSLALLALKKLQVGVALSGEECESIRNTRMFAGQLLLQHSDVFSAEGRRADLFRAKAPQSLTLERLEQLEKDISDVSRALDCSVTFDGVWTVLLKRAQETVLSVLEVVNVCRS
ncbi:MAG: hypothetical protein UV94_C0014G0001 [Parcubacteria group bacterium GW2011_GWC1_43_30]|nr:MAG: hypothetical protein UV94_C0014G0001 [Parcubacteria group bacterium GW2011_GWC1_43_30]